MFCLKTASQILWKCWWFKKKFHRIFNFWKLVDQFWIFLILNLYVQGLVARLESCFDSPIGEKKIASPYRLPSPGSGVILLFKLAFCIPLTGAELAPPCSTVSLLWHFGERTFAISAQSSANPQCIVCECVCVCVRIARDQELEPKEPLLLLLLFVVVGVCQGVLLFDRLL